MKIRPSSFAALMCVWAASTPTEILAVPNNPFVSALPGRDFGASSGERFGTAAAIEAMGSSSYSVPIQVPPGRLGMEPQLAISYSSAGALRGGLAVGWSFELPVIERDPDYPFESRWLTTLPGSSSRLVRNTQDPGTGERYRTEVDNSFTRYERNASQNTWTARTTDGQIYFFGLTAFGRSYLTRVQDRFGNTIAYFYSLSSAGGYSEYVLDRIEYGANAAANLPAHAQVVFTYVPLELCGGLPKGASTDYYFGFGRMRGSRRLTEINTSVRDTRTSPWRYVRNYTLSYDQTELDCNASALRYLTKIDGSARSPLGTWTSMPPISFEYGAKRRDLTRTINVLESPRESGVHKGPTSAFMDLDGDGRLDHVEILKEERCRLSVRRGLADGIFATTPDFVDLPSAEWGTPGSPEDDERCTLRGQYAKRGRATGPGFCYHQAVTVQYHFVDIDRDGRVDLLSALGGTTNLAGGDFDYVPGAPISDLLLCGEGQTATQVGENLYSCSCSNPGQHWDYVVDECRDSCDFTAESYNWITHECEGLCSGCTPSLPPVGGGYPECGRPSLEPQRIDTGYLWRLQKNVGGEFAPVTAASFIESPLPLPSGQGVDYSTSPDPKPTLPTLIDLNGDGWLDLVSLSQPGGTPTDVPSPPYLALYAYLGSPSGNSILFGSPRTWTIEQFWTQHWQNATWVEEVGRVVYTSPTTLALRDMNGDGLPDLVAQFGPSRSLGVSYNKSGTTSSWNTEYPSGGTFSPISDLQISQPVETARSELTQLFSAGNGTVITGDRASTTRLIDLDGDQLPEVAHFVMSGSSVANMSTSRAAFRLMPGGSVTGYVGLGAEWESLESHVRFSGGEWKRRSDFIDLTGDGLDDAVAWSHFGMATISTDEASASYRLLRRIDNGKGGSTTFEYAWSNDEAVVDLDGQPLSPRTVLSRMIDDPANGQPQEVTRYRYKHPVRGSSGPYDYKAASFIGFREVTMERSGQQGEASAQVVRVYDYTPLGHDYRGRLSTELKLLKENNVFVPARYTRNQHVSYSVANTVTHTTVLQTIDITCAPGATAASCPLQTADRKTTDHQYQAWAPLNAPIPQVHLLLRTVTSDGVDAPRFVQYEFEKRWSSTEALLLPAVEERGRVYVNSHAGGSTTLHLVSARTQTVYNAAGLPEETRLHRDATNTAITRRTFHPQTGVLLTTKKPNEVATNSWRTETLYYEELMVHLSGKLDQSGASETYVIDRGTGSMLRKVGPSYRATGGGTYANDEELWAIDGFGRVITHRDSLDPVSPTALGYDLRIVETFEYNDHLSPVERISRRLRDAADETWLVKRERFDGAGRIIESRETGPSSTDRISTFTYDAGGHLFTETRPSPADDNAVAVTQFQRDGWGRPTRVVVADGASEVTVYRGSEIETFRSAPIEGESAHTTSKHNIYGELTEVHEHDTPVVGSTAITRYSYDSLGRMANIVDADGNTTILEYDWRGLRTAVRRGTRTWAYEYDGDGNLTAQIEPVPSNGTTAQYRSIYTYDVLDRLLTSTPASRGMTAAQIARFGLGPTTYAYDGNGFFGKAHSITLPFGSIGLTYTANGQIARETRTLSLSNSVHGASLASTQWVERRYDALGSATSVKWDDGTEWQYRYAGRGLVRDVRWLNPATSSLVTLAQYDRRLAGQPYRRTSVFSPQERGFEYDVLGRVVYDRVFRTANNETLHQRNYAYDGFGLLNSVDGHTNNMNADASFAYDPRGRLLSAQGPQAYNAAFSYSSAGNVLTAAVSGAGETQNRNVIYSYSAQDPQAVSALTQVGTGAVVAGYSYDLAGNTTARTVNGLSSTYRWGGDGMLHESAGILGTESYLFGPSASRMVAIGPEGVKVWFGESEALYSLSGVQQRRYHHIAAGEPIARVQRAGVGSAPEVELQYADTLSSLALATAQNGTVRAAFVYGGFGEVVSSTGYSTHRRAFNGAEHDSASGLRHYGFRSYDPLSLRWVSADPKYRFAPEARLTDPQRANLYAFSLNNPLTYVDPDGRDPSFVAKRGIEAHLVIGATYEAMNPNNEVYTNTVTIETITGGRSKSQLKPDIVDLTRGYIWEIKPEGTSEFEAEAQLQSYIREFAKAGIHLKPGPPLKGASGWGFAMLGNYAWRVSRNGHIRYAWVPHDPQKKKVQVPVQTPSPVLAPKEDAPPAEERDSGPGFWDRLGEGAKTGVTAYVTVMGAQHIVRTYGGGLIIWAMGQ